MKLTASDLFYICDVFNVIIILYWLPLFNNSILDKVERDLPKSIYINNEITILKTGKPNEYFADYKLPNIFSKYITARIFADVNVWFIVGFSTALILIPEAIIYVIVTNIIPHKVSSYSEMHYVTFTIGVDFIIILCSFLSVINTYIQTLRNEITAIRSTLSIDTDNSFYFAYKDWINAKPNNTGKLITKDQAIEMIKDIQIRMKLHLISRKKEKENKLNE